MNETEILDRGRDVSTKELGRTDANKFIGAIIRDAGDYTKWRQYLFHGMTLEEISSEAQELWEKNNQKESVS